MGYFVFPRVRFACKLTFAVLMALVLGYHFQLATPRWAAMTAAIVAAGTAFAAGGEPFSGAIRHRGLLRIVGTFIGCIGSLAIIIATIRAPVVMLMLCCLWAGVCVWISSLVRVENAYVFALSGYTALIIIVSIQSDPLSAPVLAVERCSEIVMGIGCAVLADLLFSPRSIKPELDRAVDALLVEQFLLFQRCVSGISKEELDAAWNALVRKTHALNGMRGQLIMESGHWRNSNRRLQTMLSESWMMITQACATYLIQFNNPEPIASAVAALLEQPVATPAEAHKRLKQLRQAVAATSSHHQLSTVESWIGAATRYQLLAKGVRTNTRISRVEEALLTAEAPVKATSVERHHAMINGLRTGVASALGCLFWLLSGWSAGSASMVMIAVVTALAMRLPNPLMVAKDFVLGMLMALPVGSLMFMLILPATQQSLLLMCLALGVFTFILGIEVQKRRLGSMATLAGTINILVLSNPMTFKLSSFLDNALGQLVGSVLALMVILLIRDNAQARTGRQLLNRFVYGAVSALTTNPSRRRENYLPALYQYLFLLLNMFPRDIAKYRLALILIIAHQRLSQLDIPQNEQLSACHRQMRATAQRMIDASLDTQRSSYFEQLLQEMEDYQLTLREQQVAEPIAAAVARLTATLQRHKQALAD